MVHFMRFVFLSFFLLVAQSAHAQSTPPSFETKAQQAILVEAETGTVLFAKDADARMPTSSMSKILTIYLVFEALKESRLKLDDKIAISEHAWKQEGSRMFVNPGENVSVEDLIRGVVVQSGNDATVALAEALGGTESHFAEMMNQTAQKLGMKNSHFMNASGLPDPEHYSTARDLAILGLATIRNFPQYYHYFGEIEFTYNKIKQGNRNPLLYRNISADGIKTGHTELAGFGLVGSTLRDGRRLILVVNGLKNMQERADEPALLLDWGYREFGLYTVVKRDQKMADAAIWMGEKKTVPLLAGKDVVLSLPRGARDGLVAQARFDQPVKAPIQKGQQVGSLLITAPNVASMDIPLVAGEDIAQLGFFDRFIEKIRFFLNKGN